METKIADIIKELIQPFIDAFSFLDSHISPIQLIITRDYWRKKSTEINIAML
jgi:hypothetical protein